MGALQLIGSDLSVSVSFVIARELLEGAAEVQMADDELIACVLGLSIVFTAIENAVTIRLEERSRSSVERIEAEAEAEAESKVADGSLSPSDKKGFVSEAAEDARAKLSKRHSGLDFVKVLVGIARQIAFSITIQLLASSARAREPSRAVRLLTLIGLVVFFLFVQSNGSRNRII